MPELFRVTLWKLCLHCECCMYFKYLGVTGGTGSLTETEGLWGGAVHPQLRQL